MDGSFATSSFSLDADPVEAVVCVFDMEAFTPACGLDDAPRRISTILRSTFELVDSVLTTPDEDERSFLSFRGERPFHLKFLGDGALVMWRCPNRSDEAASFYLALVHALYQARSLYRHEKSELREEIGHPSIPTALRVGLAMGPVYRMRRGPSGHEEYIGVSINLAARLEGYCRDLGFLASGRHLKPDDLENTGFTRVKTKVSPRGFYSPEFVIADHLDFSRLNQRALAKLFDTNDEDE